jgi:hypothetical protein
VLTADQLKQAVHQKGITKTDACLLCVAAGGGEASSTRTIRERAIEAGVKGANAIQYSAHLSSAEDKVFKTPKGWELTDEGRAYVAKIAAVAITASPAGAEAKALRALLPKLSNDDAREFLTEAIVCAEQSLFRAAVVLSWAGAVAVLHDIVIAKHLSAFNAEATKRDAKWKAAKNADDLGRMKEHDFLQIIEALSIIGKNTKHELEQALKLRNACGHPNSFKLGANKVAAHLETLALNVYVPFT